MDPSCHLTGGFSLSYWWDGSGYDRDWVLSIGGYHSAYQIPSHYPRPARVGISWNISDLDVTGGAYLAITPQGCMGGGELNAVYSSGHVSAHFDASIDFLINFTPFHYRCDLGINIGVSVAIPCFFTTFHVSAEVGAKLEVVGPPLHGEAHIDISMFSFTILFGSYGNKEVKLSLLQFYDLILTGPRAKAIGTDKAADRAADRATPCVFSLTSGAVAKKKKKEQQTSPEDTAAHKPWLVHGSKFKFSLRSRFPLAKVTCNGKYEVLNTSNFYSKPKGPWSPLNTEVTMKIESDDKTTSLDIDVINVGAIESNFPTSLWGQCTSFRMRLINRY